MSPNWSLTRTLALATLVTNCARQDLRDTAHDAPTLPPIVRPVTPAVADSTYGLTTLPIRAPQGGVVDMVMQDDRKILLAGTARMDAPGYSQATAWAIARIGTDGNLDAGFGAGAGFVLASFGGPYQAPTQIFADTDHRVVVAGVRRAGDDSLDASFHLTLARFDADGLLDESFGDHGTVLTDYPPNSRVQLLRDHRLLLATASGMNRIALSAFDSTGLMDAAFGTRRYDVAGNPGPTAILEAPSGRIIVIGANWILSVLPDGEIDRSFGNKAVSCGGEADDGEVTTAVSGSIRVCNPPESGVITSDDRILIGWSGSTSGTESVARLLQNGDLDSSFAGGVVIYDSGSSFMSAPKLTLDGSDVIVTGLKGDADLTLVAYRLREDGSLDADFGTRSLAPGSRIAGRRTSCVLTATDVIIGVGVIDDPTLDPAMALITIPR